MGLGARLALMFAAVAAATALIVGGASYITADQRVTAEVDDFLRQRASDISDGRRDGPADRRDGNGRGQNRVFVAVSPDAEVQILNEDGEVRSNTELLLPVDDTDIALAEGRGTQRLRTVAIEDTDYRIVTRSLDGGGAVQVARSLDESQDLLEALRSRLAFVTVVLALFAAAVGWILAQRTTGPLRELTAAVDDIAETQDLSVPVPTSGTDEVGRLGRGFNRMLGALRQSQEQQQRLVQDAAHELRTPLTSVTANLDWLQRANDLDPETQAATLSSVRREVGELNNVITEIIQLATDSRDQPTMVPTDLRKVVDNATSLFVERTGRNVSVQPQEVSVAEVVGDADALERALTNLLSNAHKYSPPSGPVIVEVGPNGLYVNDAGDGIPGHERDAVFDRFYRRDQDRPLPGSGLGLSIVAGIVEQHGGTLHVSDSSLGGARVGFDLPFQ